MLAKDKAICMNLTFTGPFTFTGPESVFEAPCSASAGVYLWTIRQNADNAYLIRCLALRR